MPTLDWIGKRAVLNHHREIAFHLLEQDAELSTGEVGDGNMLVEGDNLLALKALLPSMAKRVKCVYIDPPYNTGVDERGADGKRTGWIYNDNVDSPEIREWLQKVVGDEYQDLTRHGCADPIQLSLNPEGHPRWALRMSWDRAATLSPSVWRRAGCRSHFFLRRGEVEWV